MHGFCGAGVVKTFRSPVTSAGLPHPRAATEDAVVANLARADKEATCPECLTSRRCELVVLALETGGRFSAEAYEFLEELAFAKARASPSPVRKSARLAWQRRWVRRGRREVHGVVPQPLLPSWP